MFLLTCQDSNEMRCFDSSFSSCENSGEKNRKKKERTYSSVELTEAEAVRGERLERDTVIRSLFLNDQDVTRLDSGNVRQTVDCFLVTSRGIYSKARGSDRVSGHVISGPVWNPIRNVPLSATQMNAQRTNQLARAVKLMRLDQLWPAVNKWEVACVCQAV